MKVLMIGQLPKEVGGNYTTGAAMVVYELSKQHVDGIRLFTYATNTREKNAEYSSEYTYQYIGYKKDILGLLKDMVCHPQKTLREWQHYIRYDHQNPLRLSFYKTNIRRAIKLTRPDLIHVHSIGNVSSTRFAMDGMRIPLLLTCHGIFYRGDASDVKGHDIYQGNLPLCDYYTGLTEESRYEFTDILGVPSTKYTIIPNGVDTSKFYFSDESRKKIREEFEVGEQTTVFLTIASLQERKGHLIFLKMLEQMNLDYQYWLIGIGQHKATIEEYVSSHHLYRRVKLLGYRNSDELFKYYSAADIYAHSSWKEGQALSEIEAYSTGMPALVNIAIKGTLIDDPQQENYCLVDFKSPDFDAIKNWISKASKYKRQSRQKYDWRNIAERYASLYKELVKN